MLRRGTLLLGLAAGAVAAAVLVAGALAGWWRSGPGRVPLQSRLVATAALSERSPLFGDPLEARVDVLVDRRTIDPASVRVSASFAPYQVTGVPSVARAAEGSAERISTTFRLTCLDDGCLPRASGFRFDPAAIRATTRDGQPASAEAAFPLLVVASRATAAEAKAARPAWHGGSADLVPVTWGIDPDLLAGLAAGGCGLLALLGGGLAVYALRSTRPRVALSGADGRPRTALELALGLARQAARGGAAADRRRALELLASVLRRRGEADLARRATRLAWSPERPSPTRVEEFADAVAHDEEVRA